jgi:hypothetical protein
MTTTDDIKITHPNREPIFSSVKFEESGFVWLRVAVDLGNGTTDFIQESICPVDEGHALFIEVEEEHLERMKRNLKQRNKAKLAT